MTAYIVTTEVRYEHEVEADSPEEAAQLVEEGESGPGDSVDAAVVSVSAPLDREREDLREPAPCSGGCGKRIAAVDMNPCPECFLASLAARQAAFKISHEGTPTS